jgi:MarR family transcriptional regulator, organic hydroperoxide resistance regulator
MKTRKQFTEEIMGNMHSIGRKFALGWLDKSDKTIKSDRDEGAHITSSQWMALAIVMRKRNLNITELAETLGVTASAATQLVDELVTKGYLVREDKTGDRRMLLLSLSNKCKKKIGDMKARKMDRFAHIFDALTTKELEKYANLNKKIAESIFKKTL